MSNTKRIWVPGAKGQVGSELQALHKNTEATFHFTDMEVDLTDEQAIARTFKKIKPTAVINCAAYTAVDKAEDEVELNQKVNDIAVGYLAKGCKENDCKLIHFSSDYVYHIDKNSPLVESDICMPQGQYAVAKLAGEKKIQEHMPHNFAIIRTSWVYSSFGNNFVKTMIRLGKERDKLTIVNDQIGAPTYARDIAKTSLAILPYLEKDREKYAGVYNYCNSGKTNWNAFAQKIFELEDITCEVSPTTTAAYGAKAPRPLWSVMDTSKITQTFDLTIPSWEDSLRHCLDLLNN